MLLSNLPVQLTSFVGRARETEEVQRQVSASRLVTLTGAGGCGKTRLALQVAGVMGSVFADGVWLVELASLRDAALIPDFVAQALGVHSLPNQPLHDLLLGYVRPRRMLLLLDNCEHLIIACAELAQTLLAAAPNLTILATSREPLALAGEMLHQVSPLSLPPGLESAQGAPNRSPSFTPQAASGYDAIQLFVERARAVLPDFALTPANTGAVVTICRRLDGIPLAIELASARANVLTVQQIAERLDDRFALLISSHRTTHVPYHHTMRAAIDWSHDLLTEEEQVLLRSLAVFASGFTLDTIRGICGVDGIAEGRTLDLVASLVNKSLLVATTLGRVEARYRLLETVRDYALEKMNQAGEAVRLRDCHLELFLARAEEAAPRLGDAYQQLWLAWLESEHDNLRAALAWALESGRIEAGLRIAIAIARFWEIRGHVPEALAWFERLLAKADESIPLVVRANALTYAGFLAMFLSDAAAATAYGRQAVALAEAAGDKGNPILILALAGLAAGARAAGDYQAAFASGERTIQLMRNSPGNPLLLGMSLLAQGEVAVELGYFDRSRALLAESLALAQEAGDNFRIARTINSLGDLARGEGKYAEALPAYEKSAALLRELGARHDLAAVLRNQGRTCLQLRDVVRAHALFSESMAAHRAEQDLPGVAECLIGFAGTALEWGLPAGGARLLAAAAAIGGPRRVALVWPAKPMEYDRYLALACARLSAAEFQAELAAGSGLSLEQAMELALRLAPKRDSTTAIREMADGLTAREREIAALIALGKSNGEIAGELVLSKRTVEKHISSIFAKLGIASRTEVVWPANESIRT